MVAKEENHSQQDTEILLAKLFIRVSLQHLPLYFSQGMVFLARTVPVRSVDSYISGLQCDLVCSVVVG